LWPLLNNLFYNVLAEFIENTECIAEEVQLKNRIFSPSGKEQKNKVG
jgi:hypothetical protein